MLELLRLLLLRLPLLLLLKQLLMRLLLPMLHLRQHSMLAVLDLGRLVLA